MRKRLSLFAFMVLAAPVAMSAASPTLKSAEYCGGCHRAIEEGWKQSVHSQAMESRLFQDALQMAAADFGQGARKVCLGCHSPTLKVTGDWQLKDKVSWEGITCEYCHSMRSVTMVGGNPEAVVEYTNTMAGPWKNVTSPVHGTVYSPLHTSPLLCATCHQYRNAQGFAVLTTYSEWEKGPYAAKHEGCQWCHMSKVEGSVVDPKVMQTGTHEINLHEMPGSHSLVQLNKAIRGRLSVSHVDGELHVEVDVTNQGAGHMVPTGSPLRRLILRVHAAPFSGKTYDEERDFTRVVADRNGKILNREDLVFIKAAKVVSDTRLAPNETRKELFTFKVPQGVPSTVEADFIYYYSPMATTQAQQQVQFLSLRRFVQ